MPNIAHDLFLLMSNLTQLKGREDVIRVFIEAVNSFDPGFSIRLRDGQTVDRKVKKGLDEGIDGVGICTARRYFGAFLLEGRLESVAPEFPGLFQNAVQMLAIILEKLRQEKLLADEKLVLQDMVNEKVASLQESEERIKAALKEKEILLQELYHRTKNNMAVIASMLSLQASYVGDDCARDILLTTENRIKTMALVHRKLYQGENLSRIDLRDYIRELSELLMRSYRVKPAKIALHFDMQSISALIDTAIPCGLVLNELMSNAFKYAFPGERTGEIRVGLHRGDPGEIELFFADNGVGVPTGFDFENSETFGMQSIFGIIEHQLQGRVVFESGKGKGVTCTMCFSDALYKERI